MAAAGAPAPCTSTFIGLLNQGHLTHTLQHQLQLQQVLARYQQPPPSLRNVDGGSVCQSAPGQFTTRAVAVAGPHQPMAGQASAAQHTNQASQQPQYNAEARLAGPAAPGGLCAGNPTQQQVTDPRSTAAAAAAGLVIKHAPSSPVAGSPTAAGNSSASNDGAAAKSPASSAPIKAAAGAGGSGYSRLQLPPPSPLPAPEEGDSSEAIAEYSRYLQRWQDGVTLAQRWHRLSESGLLVDIVEEWEEWQHDLLLQELQQHNKALAKQTRKHKRDEVDVELDPDAPRQSRARRVPTALQDYQVDATTTPEPPAIGTAGAVAAALGSRCGAAGPGRGPAQPGAQAALLQAGGMTYPDASVGDGFAAGFDNGSKGPRSAGQTCAKGRGGGGAGASGRGNQVYNSTAKAALQQHAYQQHYGSFVHPQLQQQPVLAANGYSYVQQQQSQHLGAGHSREAGRHAEQDQQQYHPAAAAHWQQGMQQQQQQGLVNRPKQQQAANGYNQAVGAAASHPMQPQQQQQQQQQAELLARCHQVGAIIGSSVAHGAAAAGSAGAAGGSACGVDRAALEAFMARTFMNANMDPLAFTQQLSSYMQQHQQQAQVPQ